MTARMKCGQRKPGPGRIAYCSVCEECEQFPSDNDDAWEGAVAALNARLNRLTRHRTLYHRRHRHW